MTATSRALPAAPAGTTHFRALSALSFSHFLNDMTQSTILAIYPLLKSTFALSFTQIGVISLVYQVTASLMQPLVGRYTDKHPLPYSLSFGMAATLLGLLVLAFAPNFAMLLVAATLVGIGSAVFHPEASRIARFASGGRHGLAQSIFQVGGNAGSAAGPLIAAALVLPFGQHSLAWLALAALVGITLLWRVGTWHKQRQLAAVRAPHSVAAAGRSTLPPTLVTRTIAVLLLLIFSKYFYLASLTSYYTFYLIARFQTSLQAAQMHLFVFLLATAAGTLLGGPIGDRIGRKRVIWASILGVAPFTLALPHLDLAWTTACTVVIGFVIASAFSAILVFAQELVPGKVGTVSGLFFGFAFGMGGLGAAVLGAVADARGIEYVYSVCAYLPLLGLLTALLPDERRLVGAPPGAQENSERVAAPEQPALPA
ncbi:MAG: MFS transporter [Pseudomonadota bacterium]|nr:MFS transporter [Pseudomonadota bacterium]